jgi:hypothetical protein
MKGRLYAGMCRGAFIFALAFPYHHAGRMWVAPNFAFRDAEPVFPIAPLKERTLSRGSDDEKQDYVTERIDYKARYPAVDERKLVRKIDLHLVPTLCILYLLAFLDR